MSADSIPVEPGDIAMLGDDIRAHLADFSAAERMAVALYLLSLSKIEIAPVEMPRADMLAERAIAIGVMEHAA
jgi:hypothetical protein